MLYALEVAGSATNYNCTSYATTLLETPRLRGGVSILCT